MRKRYIQDIAARSETLIPTLSIYAATGAQFEVWHKGGVQQNQVKSTCLQHLCVSNLYI